MSSNGCEKRRELVGVNEDVRVDHHTRQSVVAGLSPVVDCLAAGQ